MQALHHSLHHGSGRRKGLNALRQLARSTLAQAGQTRSDIEAQTRYSEEDTSSIFIVKAIDSDSENQQTRITLLNGEMVNLPWKIQALSRQKWRQLSCLLQRQMVPCRKSLLPTCLKYKRCRDLGFHHVFYLGNGLNDEINFAIAIQGIDGALNGFEITLPDTHHYEYRSDIGLRINKINS